MVPVPPGVQVRCRVNVVGTLFARVATPPNIIDIIKEEHSPETIEQRAQDVKRAPVRKRVSH